MAAGTLKRRVAHDVTVKDLEKAVKISNVYNYNLLSPSILIFSGNTEETQESEVDALIEETRLVPPL